MQRHEFAVIWLCMTALAVFAYLGHTYFLELDLVVAWGGFSAVDFANSVLYPENFSKDYPGGAAFIGNSLLVWIYPFVASYLGIQPIVAMYMMIACEVVLLIAGAVLILRTLLPQTLPYSFVLLAILFLASSARQIDLARFGTPFLVGQFYVFADMLRLAALCALLTHRYVLMAVLLTAGFTIHPSMTALTLPVLFFAFLIDKSELKRPTPWIAAVVSVTFSAIWFFEFIASQSLTGPEIPEFEYIEFSRLFNFHWYLSDLGMILPNPDRVLLPFMGLVLVGVEALRRTPELGDLRRKQILVMISVICIVSLFGLLAAEHKWSVKLLKISPQRLSAFGALLLLPIIVHRLFRDLLGGNYGYVLIGIAFLATALFQKYPYSIVLALLYASPVIGAIVHRPKLWSYETAVVLFALPPALLLALHFHAGYQLSFARYFGTPWLFALSLVGVALILIQSATSIKLWHLPNWLARLTALSILLISMILSYLWITERYTLTENRRTTASEYKEVQLWAQSNSDPTDLFMTDPCISYGWRDFSQRSSWGSIQEFLKNGWLYSGNLNNFDEGLARAKRIGIDSRKMLQEDPSSIRRNFRNVCSIARRIYYAQDLDWMTNMVRDYEIDYFVYLKEHAVDGPRYTPVFENDTFFVLDVASLNAS